MKALSQHEKAQKGEALTSNAGIRTLASQHDTTISSLCTQASQDRLDSWKEIATYFGREVRTVQRWEKHECLPVHRHFHHKIGSVYAFKAELEKWRMDRSSGPCANDCAGTKSTEFPCKAALAVQLQDQLVIPPVATRPSSHGKNGNLFHAIILVTPELQPLPKELRALDLGKLMTTESQQETEGVPASQLSPSPAHNNERSP